MEVHIGIISKMQDAVNTLPVHWDSNFSERYKKNHLVILKTIALVVHLIGKQSLALKGDREDK